MSKIKIVFWFLIISFLSLLVLQNKDFFLAPSTLAINLYFISGQSPLLPNAILFAAFLLAGWLIAYAFNLFERFKANKMIKGLKSQLAAHQGEMDQLRRDVEALKPIQPSNGTGREAEPAGYGDAAAENARTNQA